MKKKKNLWFARIIIILFLGVSLAQLMLDSPAVLSAVRALMYLGVLYAGFTYGAGAGGSVGAVCGMLETFHQENLTPLGIFCLMGVLSGVFRPLGRAASSIAFLCGAVGIGMSYAVDYLTASVFEIVAAVLLFFLLPQELLKKPQEKHSGQNGLEKMQRQRLKETASSYGRLAQSLQSLESRERFLSQEQAAQAIARASSIVCGGCRLCSLGKQDAPKEIPSLCDDWQEKGRLTREDMPEDFQGECRRQDLYLETLSDCLDSMNYEEEWRGRFFESREAASLQFREMERTLNGIAQELDETVDVTARVERGVRRMLRRRRLKMEQLLVLEGAEARKEAFVTVSAASGGCVTVKELSESMGKTLSRNLRATDSGRTVVGKEPCTIRLVEDTKFRLLSGVARAVKEGEELSGDNFSCHLLPDGRMMLCLSDGMGSGRRAFAESELVTELLEELLEAGFSAERAISMLNAFLLVRKEQRPATLDLALIDLYTGQARFYKQGAVSTFIRRGGQVLEIAAGSLPIGVDCGATPVCVQQCLEDGDMIVMVTDGILDSLNGTDKEGVMEEFLAQNHADNARELAEQVLTANWSADMPAKDDMTVLAAGLWKK